MGVYRGTTVLGVHMAGLFMPFCKIFGSSRISGKSLFSKYAELKIFKIFVTKSWPNDIPYAIVEAFNETICNPFYNDGDRVKIIGRLQSSLWEYEGQKYHYFQIVADKIDRQEESAGTFERKITRIISFLFLTVKTLP